MRVICLTDFLPQVVMSFHECGGNVGDDVCIPLPNWVAEIGRSNPDIFFTDREGRRNPECLSWGIDKERVLRGRTAIEVHPGVAVRLYLIIALYGRQLRSFSVTLCKYPHECLLL